MESEGGRWDFFISYTAADLSWAEWIAWQLEDAGYRVLIQAWDTRTGSNWSAATFEGIAGSARTIAVLSEAYLRSVYGNTEMQAAWSADPQGIMRKLIPIRIEECERPGLLAQIVSLDLFGIDEKTARSRLLQEINSITSGRAKPRESPVFPSFAQPAFPPTFFVSARGSSKSMSDPPEKELGVSFLPAPLSDEPTIDDRLDFAPDVRRLAAVISASSTAPPLAIALLGPWGSGKSSFMRQVAERVKDTYTGKPGYVRSVRHVTFNAWHYSDTEVWVGLVENLFSELAVRPDGSNKSRSERLADDAARIKIQRELRKLEERKERLDGDLEKIDAKSETTGVFSTLPSPGKIFSTLTASLRRTLVELSESRSALLSLIAVMAVATVGWAVVRPLIGSATATVLAFSIYVAGTFATVAAPAWRAISRVAFLTENQRRRLESSQEELEQRIAKVREEMALVDASVSLANYLSEHEKESTYKNYRGLVGEIRRDLDGLANALAEARKGPNPHVLDRIVLYIDDLDRCRPKTVVQVLEAAHLLLATQLFVVIVAVDVRWLVQSFSLYYSEIFGITSTGDLEEKSLEYLDKIFQIPFSLPQMRGLKSRNFLKSITPDIDEKEVEEGDLNQVEGNVSDPQKSIPSGHVTDTATMAASSPGAGFAIPARKLRITEVERDFIPNIAPLMPTPRAGKKLINLYRLIRSSVPDSDMEKFVGTSEKGGDFQVVLLMLGIVIAVPARARIIILRIQNAPENQDFVEFLNAEGSDPNNGNRAGDLLGGLADLIENLRREIVVVGQIGRYQEWCPEIQRFVF